MALDNRPAMADCDVHVHFCKEVTSSRDKRVNPARLSDGWMKRDAILQSKWQNYSWPLSFCFQHPHFIPTTAQQQCSEKKRERRLEG